MVGIEDKDLGTVINSYTTLHGDFDKKGINRFSYPTRNVDFTFELIVRDASVKETALERGLAKKSAEDEDEKVMVDLTPL